MITTPMAMVDVEAISDSSLKDGSFKQPYKPKPQNTVAKIKMDTL